MLKPKILVVEDEILIAEYIKSILNNNGYDVVSLSLSGENALRKIAENKPDLIILDINLKGILDGIDTAMMIHEKLKVPVVFVTAYCDLATINKARIARPAGYIVKPFTETQLLMITAQALKSHVGKVKVS